MEGQSFDSRAFPRLRYRLRHCYRMDGTGHEATLASRPRYIRRGASIHGTHSPNITKNIIIFSMKFQTNINVKLFQIENLFCLGSPLSVFLALRTRTPTSRLDVMPKGLCKRFYNIFHWSDPVAYRMEPLLERGYSKIDPVLILPYGGVDSQVIEPPPSITSGEQAISPPGKNIHDPISPLLRPDLRQ